MVSLIWCFNSYSINIFNSSLICFAVLKLPFQFGIVSASRITMSWQYAFFSSFQYSFSDNNYIYRTLVLPLTLRREVSSNGLCASKLYSCRLIILPKYEYTNAEARFTQLLTWVRQILPTCMWLSPIYSVQLVKQNLFLNWTHRLVKGGSILCIIGFDVSILRPISIFYFFLRCKKLQI